ncbi:zinc-dependent alcohol dehydrogenase [Aestuariimicrobium ganziense]|uniref:zinc-dependent alcohol dehydrogenase n=1 Tax=Aestuariimicrobium ganziense TaxID=2773677 RepID=UPI0019423B27|nr:zinc-binding dehydrogenase [Aestuariimicrobium ganziense]
MKALRLHAAGDVRVHDEDEPTAAEGRTLVRITAVGICGSDLHWFEDGNIGDAGLTRPLVPGHETAGVAVDGPYAGQVVAVDPAIPCGHCEMCEEGHRNLCPTVQFSGHSTLDGSMQQLISWPTHLLHPLPEGFTAADGAVLEPLGVALHAWDLAHVPVGATVAVVGCGPIGLLLVQLALASGAARVIAVEPLAHRRDMATQYGAEVVLTPDEAREASTWERLTGLGAHVVFEVAGNDDAVTTSCLACRPGGRVMLVGIPSDDHIGFTAGPARRKGIDLRLVRRMKEMYPRTIELVRSGKIDVRSMVTQTVGLDEAASAFADASARKGLKVVIDPSK